MAEKSPRHRPGPWKIFVGLGTTVVLVVALVFLTGRDDPAVNDAAAPDITLSYFDGSTETLRDLAGRPVVLNFWASWCPACIGEMPAFGNVHRSLGDQVEFIGVNMQEVDLDAAIELADVTRVDYPLVHDPSGAIFREFGGLAMPTTVFISADGSVVRVHSGVISESALIDVIENQLFG